ncbi:hypothetical protein OC842_006153 [Tilletia horrida]|uniref:PWWP domain-containing protein n=1 Tax=Tilletia horrida TaxID=155126 RepID=A0AAN6G6G9_9BASI|nr:hypothetical protein OC842_006153 [Tilletia horrida]
MAPGSKKSKDQVHNQLHDIVLTKMKGYPAWPSWVTTENLVPHKVAKAKPKVGKYVLCAFFNDMTYFWAPPRDVKPLTKEMIEDYLTNEANKKEGKEVRGAYDAARNPASHIREKEAAAYKDNNQEDEEAEGQDELAEEDEDEGGASAGSKRKRNKEKTKAKVPAKKQKKEKDSSAAVPTKASSKKQKPRASEAVTEIGDEAENEEQMSPETKQVKNWRHQLQRAFLGKTAPKDSEMPAMAEIFTQVEAHAMSEDALKQTKIGKVMKKITQAKEEIPRDAEFKFKERAEELCKKWKHISSGDGAAADSPAQDKPAAGGDAKPPSTKANGTPAPAAPSSGGAEQDKPTSAPKEDAKPEAAA